jgi:hypothetical protein
MTYPYTATDLLEGEPCHYFFAPFAGSGLLAGYAADRAAALARFARLAAAAPEEKGEAGSPPFAGIFSRRVDTDADLAAAAAWVRRGGDSSAAELVAWVDGLLHKIEVVKRLRRSYGPGLAVTEPTPASLDAYCRLSFLAARRLTGADDLKRLNALLKLGDLVISSAAIPSPAAARDMAEAIRAERAAVAELAARHRVEVPR